ncbi:MAG: RNA methyltransferase [Phycisphaerae bacterium]|nr:RNA methyltransferase [Phycisphaerae bacterium]
MQHKKKARYEQGCFIIEGYKEFIHARNAGIIFSAIIHCPGINPYYSHQYDCELIEVTPEVYEKIAYRGKTEGLLAIAKIPETTIDNLKLKDDCLILIAQGVEKPGNLGALLRTADAVGVDAMIVADNVGIDIYNPNAVRASLGALFTVPTFVLSIDQTCNWLKQNNIKAILTSPDATTNYTDIDYKGRTAIILGSEHDGLPTDWLSQADQKVTIPMNGKMDSLNVSCSAAILLYEALRQRSQ